MKKLPFVLVFLLGLVLPAAAQNQVRQRLSTEREPQNSTVPATRNRVTSDGQPANHVKREAAPSPSSNSSDNTKPAWGDTSVGLNVNSTPPRVAAKPPVQVKTQTNPAPPALVKRTSLSVDNSPTPSNVRSPAPTTATAIYRVGVGDVLDIRLANLSTRASTLFTVMKNGTLEYPLMVSPIPVAGLTPDEIARRLSAEIKVIQNPKPIVSVRDYASHGVLITGAVDNPGRKMLRREAVPLFTVLSEALPRSDAATVVVLRNGKEMTLSLSRSADLSTLIVAGDALRVIAAIKQFVYVGGDVTSAGEKELREGMTLTQAVLAAGGVRADAQNKVKVTRRDPGGFLKSEEYNLSSIESGKMADPLLQPGDRIEVKRAM